MRSALSARACRSQLPQSRKAPYAPLSRTRKTFSVLARGHTPKEPEPARKEDDGPLQTALRTASAAWSRLDTQQRVYAVVAGAALLAATPQLLTFGLIAVERLLVGLLLAVEEVLAAGLLLGARLVVLVGSLVLLGVGAYLFLFRKQNGQ